MVLAIVSPALFASVRSILAGSGVQVVRIVRGGSHMKALLATTVTARGRPYPRCLS